MNLTKPNFVAVAQLNLDHLQLVYLYLDLYFGRTKNYAITALFHQNNNNLSFKSPFDANPFVLGWY